MWQRAFEAFEVPNERALIEPNLVRSHSSCQCWLCAERALPADWCFGLRAHVKRTAWLVTRLVAMAMGQIYNPSRGKVDRHHRLVSPQLQEWRLWQMVVRVERKPCVLHCATKASNSGITWQVLTGTSIESTISSSVCSLWSSPVHCLRWMLGRFQYHSKDITILKDDGQGRRPTREVIVRAELSFTCADDPHGRAVTGHERPHGRRGSWRSLCISLYVRFLGFSKELYPHLEIQFQDMARKFRTSTWQISRRMEWMKVWHSELRSVTKESY